MGEQQWNEKQDEKANEKEEEKREEKGEEKRHEDPVSMIAWAAILIWAGIVLLASNLGLFTFFDRLIEALPIPGPNLPFEIPFVRPNAWSVFFLGAGLIVLAEIIVRLLVPAYRRSLLGNVIVAIVLFGLALGSWNLIWPLILIAIGFAILVGGFIRRR